MSAYPNIETRNPLAGIEVDQLFLYPKENASNHKTAKYELVMEQQTSVLRRGAPFFIAIKSKSRPIDVGGKDVVNIIFEFGKSNINQRLITMISINDKYYETL